MDHASLTAAEVLKGVAHDHEIQQGGGGVSGESYVVLERAEYLAWVRGGIIGRRRAGEHKPKVEHIAVGHISEIGLESTQEASQQQAASGELNDVALLVVHVAYDQARLAKPVQKYFELGKVVWRLVTGGVHLLRRKANPPHQGKEVAA